MVWKTDPDRLHPYEQKGGYCYGICRLLLEAVGFHVYKNDSPDSVFEDIQKQLRTHADIGAKGAQITRRYEGRRQASKFYAMKENVTYIVGCNILIQPGYLTRYAISSYFDKKAWNANHAVVFIGLSGSTIVCDPNWGCGLWRGLGIGSLPWSDMNSLIEGGYSAIVPVYSTEISY